jgi:uncharacterized Zn finger protein
MSWTYYSEYKPRIRVEGGIKAQSQKGAFGSTWWGKRWVDTLESFGMGERIARGKTYARKGQVLSIKYDVKGVTAKVQGSDTKPYSITINLTQYDQKTWDRIIEATSRKVLVAAKLLAGQLPPSMEDIFKQQKVGLFPITETDLKTDCSCPDWSNPCKHTAAVYCLLAEEFDQDPFIVFKLRGLSKEDFIKALEKHLGCSFGCRLTDEPNPSPMAPKEELYSQPITPTPITSLEDFSTEKPLESLPIPNTTPAYERLGKFSFWRSDTPLQSFIKKALKS